MRFSYNELTTVTHLIMRNMTSGAFSADGPKATACPCFALLASTRPDLLNQLGASTSCLLRSHLRASHTCTCAQRAWPSGGEGMRGVLVDRSPRLTVRLPRHIPKLVQSNASGASARALDGGGKVSGRGALARSPLG